MREFLRIVKTEPPDVPVSPLLRTNKSYVKEISRLHTPDNITQDRQGRQTA